MGARPGLLLGSLVLVFAAAALEPEDAWNSPTCADYRSVRRMQAAFEHFAPTSLQASKHLCGNEVAVVEEFGVVFVANQKAGTGTILEMLGLGHGRGDYRDTGTGIRRGQYACFEAHNRSDYVVFTFVRDPLDILLSALRTIYGRERECLDAATRVEGLLEAFASPENALDGAASKQMFHAWPQILKLSAVDHLDFIGRIEDFDAELARLKRLVDARGAAGGRFDSSWIRPGAARVHAAQQECYQNTSAATLTPYAARLLVALFHGDYRCLGYDPPAGYALPAAEAARRRFDDDLMMRRPAAPAARAGGYCAPCAVEPDDGRRRPHHPPPHGRRRGRQVGPM